MTCVATPQVKMANRLWDPVLSLSASGHSLGFEDEDLGSSPGWWAATVAIYCPSRPGELPKFVSSKPSERPDAPLCSFIEMLQKSNEKGT